MRLNNTGFAVIVLALTISGCLPGDRATHINPNVLPDQWRTRAEQTGYDQTGRYAEVVDFCRRLADASPYAHYTTFGVTGEGRDLPLLVLSRDQAFTPAAARRSGKPIVLIQNCIHSGECEGKDACLELARDILITGTQADLLAHVTLLIMPIFNADGHERMSPYSRINQNGPREMGWRTTAVNLNLNRDYAKADAVEMRAWLHLWTTWQPDLFIDDHTTDGEDHRYDLFYAGTDGQDVAEPIAAWFRDKLYPGVLDPLAAEGYQVLPYCWLRNRKAPSEGLATSGPMSPRLSTGYCAACNRPALLVETHALNPYSRRVRATYDFLRHTLTVMNQDADGLRRAIRQADERCAATRGGERDGRVPLRFEHAQPPRRITYRAYEQRLHQSDITGDEVIEYTRTPLDVETDLFDQARVVLSVVPPAAYLIPPQWTDVIERLELHGIRFARLDKPQSLDVESYRFEEVKFADAPHEGRQIPTYKAVPIRQRRDCVAGTVVVPLNQSRAKLAVHLLEPDGPDSLAAWGFFNAIFEQKEYAEAYVMEPIARRMFAEDPELRREFENKLQIDEAFAKNPGQRLDFFYQRSPWGDTQHNIYPVARLTDPAALRGLSWQR